MELDLVIRGGRIIDGAGSPGFRGDIGIRDGRICEIGLLRRGSASREIDADGLMVAPGFIDMHSHADISLLFDNTFQSVVRQGITTVVVGNCGTSLAPVAPNKVDQLLGFLAVDVPPDVALDSLPWRTFAQYLYQTERRKCAVNLVHLVGFGAVRIAGGPGFEDHPPTDKELEAMKGDVSEAMEAGAFGMSTGLIYPPQNFAATDEIVELAKVVGSYGGVYASHIRGEGATVVKATEELIGIVEASGCPGGQLSHHKVAGRSYWGTSEKTLRLLEEANERGLNVTCDQYPYTRGMTSLVTLLPPWVHLGGRNRLLERLRDPQVRLRIQEEAIQGVGGWEDWIKEVGFDSIYIASVKTEKWRGVEGKSIAEIVKLRGEKDEWEVLFEVLADEKAEAGMTIESMDEEDIRRIMKGRYTMFGTDSSAVSPEGVLGYGKPHPRYYGTYPRILGRYVREQGVLTLEEAVRKMSSFPAQRLGLWDRGLLRPGMWADLVVFDQEKVIDRSTYADPHRFPEGIVHVLVNGEIVVKNGSQSRALPGKVLRRRPLEDRKA